MKIGIENYRGFDIFFDTDKETFYYISNGYDVDGNKQSFSAAKKAIDEFLKENQTFKPFWVEPNPNGYGWTKEKKKIMGIRKDGRFIFENEKGEKGQISDYNLKDYIIADPENKDAWDILKGLQAQLEAIHKAINRHKATRFKIKTLADVKKEILGQ